MIGLVLYAHAGLAEAYLQTLNQVVGPQEGVACVQVDGENSADVLIKRLESAIKSVDSGEGVIVITDLFGGSPANVSLARMIPGRVEVLSGLNLAMLLKAIDLRYRKLSDPAVMARAMVREGRDNIIQASELLERQKAGEAGTVRDDAGGAGCQ